MSGAPAPLRDVMVVGGGCYGNFYTGQLEAACRRGGLSVRRILIVDRDPACLAGTTPGRTIVTADWDAYLEAFLGAPPPGPDEPDDAVVPSPLMPHLMAGWLLAQARSRWPGREVALASPAEPLGTPYDSLGPDGTRYVSFADWICPTHCIEPLTCPMIRAPRTWEMGDALREYTGRLAARRPTRGPALFTTRHHAFGVGLFGAAEIRASRSAMMEAGGSGQPVDMVVGTVSACHGAVSLLRFGPRSGAAGPLY
ncbi:MAG TPA: hypothetical protein VF187_02770 [Gemmatimonadales bacterium]